MRKLLKPQSGNVTQEIAEDALCLVGAKLRAPLAWSEKRLNEAYDWAMRMHLKASDNARVRVPPMPHFLQWELRL
jgi:hypothetical protein